jgi:hypothetical protein
LGALIQAVQGASLALLKIMEGLEESNDSVPDEQVTTILDELVGSINEMVS